MSSSSSTKHVHAPTDFVFVNWAPKSNDGNIGRKSQAGVRAQAARASAPVRLETIRRRASDRPGDRGQHVFAAAVPGKTMKKKKEKNAAKQNAVRKETQLLLSCYQDREASVTAHADQILGGTIPTAQLNVAVLGNLLQRFSIGTTTERPWIQLVTNGTTYQATSPMVLASLRACGTALCANDLQRPEIHQHARDQYSSAIVQLQAALNSPRWSDSAVLYTCLILNFFACIQFNDTNARTAHVRGAAELFRQRGPRSFANGMEHKTFRYFRINILMMALVDRQATFLAEPEWKTIPFSGDGPPKTMLESLLDILLELPGVLASIEALKNGNLGRYTLIKKAFELAYWVRCLMNDLETWKQTHIWLHPDFSTAPQLKTLSLRALCEHGMSLSPYQYPVGEALNCYSAAHLILARIVWGLAQKSLIMSAALRPPYSIHNLNEAIVLVSRKHIDETSSGMISLIVTTFALKAVATTTELDDEQLRNHAQEMLDEINASFARKFNIKLSVTFKNQ